MRGQGTFEYMLLLLAVIVVVVILFSNMFSGAREVKGGIEEVASQLR